MTRRFRVCRPPPLGASALSLTRALSLTPTLTLTLSQRAPPALSVWALCGGVMRVWCVPGVHGGVFSCRSILTSLAPRSLLIPSRPARSRSLCFVFCVAAVAGGRVGAGGGGVPGVGTPFPAGAFPAVGGDGPRGPPGSHQGQASFGFPENSPIEWNLLST